MTSDRRSIADEVRKLVGLPIWSPRLGVGSFVTIEFGGTRHSSVGLLVGEYSLWVYGAAWSLGRGEADVATSDDAAPRMSAAVSALAGGLVTGACCDPASLGLRIEIDHASVLTTVAADDDDMEHWLLYLPDETVIVAGPGRSLVRERADLSEPLPVAGDEAET